MKIILPLVLVGASSCILAAVLFSRHSASQLVDVVPTPTRDSASSGDTTTQLEMPVVEGSSHQVEADLAPLVAAIPPAAGTTVSPEDGTRTERERDQMEKSIKRYLRNQKLVADAAQKK